MKHLFYSLFILILLGSCNTATPVLSPFNTSDLPSQFVHINTDRDTTLQLNGGTIITIPAHSLESEQGIMVKLEIKEAVSMEDIITAGLFTESNGEPLRSAGMIYISPVGVEKVRILKPIQIKVPSNDLSDKMMLFKGEEKDGGINWISPQALPSKPNKVDVAAGKIMFQQNCAPCHAVDKKLVAPALYGTMQRWKHDTAAVFRYTRNNAEVLASGDPYACCIFNEYNKLAMPAFPTLSDKDLEAIYHYIDQQGQEKMGAVPPKLATSECNDCPAMVDSVSATSFFEGDTSAAITDPNVIAILKSPYYTLEITNFGWFNLDQFLKESNICKPATINVQIKGQQKDESISMSLIIPYYKINQQGWLLNDGKTTGFGESDEEILLPVGTTAYVMVVGMGADKKKFSYGLTKFTTSSKQSLTVELRPGNKRAILKSIGAFEQSAGIIKNDPASLSVKYTQLDTLCSCYQVPMPALPMN